MKISPWILGAAALVPVAGALAGAAVNTDPVGPGGDVSAALPQQTVFAQDAAPRTRDRLPDHYAMETPEGRVEVAELAMRGRYGQARHQPSYHHASVDDTYWRDAKWSSATYETTEATAALDAQQPVIPRNEVERAPARKPKVSPVATHPDNQSAAEPRTIRVAVVQELPGDG